MSELGRCSVNFDFDFEVAQLVILERRGSEKTPLFGFHVVCKEKMDSMPHGVDVINKVYCSLSQGIEMCHALVIAFKTRSRLLTTKKWALFILRHLRPRAEREGSG
jgi:hypothetical protein